jgi:hypothetical protein
MQITDREPIYFIKMYETLMQKDMRSKLTGLIKLRFILYCSNYEKTISQNIFKGDY